MFKRALAAVATAGLLVALTPGVSSATVTSVPIPGTPSFDGSVDVVLCNPPFHSDGAVTDLVARRMIAAAGRILRPGGELWTVFNSHLAHPAELRRSVGPTKIIERSAKFTVARSRRES